MSLIKQSFTAVCSIFTGLLTGEAHRCEYCGHDSATRHAYQESFIQLLPYQEVPSYLYLYKQRFRCTQSHHTFSAKTYYVAKNCYISQALKFAIVVDLKKRFQRKERYFVSTKTVELVLDSFLKNHIKRPIIYLSIFSLMNSKGLVIAKTPCALSSAMRILIKFLIY